MAISFINNALGGTTTTTSFSITLPATAVGDIIILEFSHRGTGNGTIGGTYSGPAFTLKHSQLFGSSLFSGKTYYSRATGNHTGQTVTGSSLTNACAAIVTVYRGCVDTGDPLADATVVGEENASGNETQAQITTATDGAWVVLVVVNSPDLAISTQACTSPGTLTERAERLSTGGTDASIAHASAVKATAGGTGNLTWAQTNAASGSWAYALVPQPANNILVTPGVVAAVTAVFAPVIAITNHVLATVGAAALTASLLACTVTTPQTLTPSVLAASLTTFAPDVLAPSGATATPGYIQLATQSFAPTVLIPQTVTVTPTALATTAFAPTVALPQRVTLTTLAHTLTVYAPVVVAINPQLVTVPLTSHTTERFPPTITTGIRVVIGTLTLGGVSGPLIITD